MSFKTEHRSVYVPEFWTGSPSEHIRKVANSVNQILRGMTNNHFTITLEPDETATDIPYEACRPGVSPLLTPQSASAATSMASGLIYVEPQTGNCRINHDASPATDRKFSLVLIG